MKKISILLFLSVFSLFAYSQTKDLCTYYSGADGKQQAALKTALHKIIGSHTTVSYNNLYDVYNDADKKPDGTIWDIYSEGCNFRSNKCGNYDAVCDCYNREHTVPQSWFGKAAPMVSDAFQVLPTDGKVNGQRSNHPYGECAGGTTLSAPTGKKALGKLGSSTFKGYTGTVFEPVDEYKGDIARIYFYFATCYEDKNVSGASFTNNGKLDLSPWTKELMLKWHRQDPVSQKEIDRNNAVEKHQKNRNPFVDYPELAEHIWGTKQNVSWTCGTPAKPGEGGSGGGGEQGGTSYVVTLSGKTLTIQGLNKNELIEVIDGIGNVVYKSVTGCSIHTITVPTTGLHTVKINGVQVGEKLDIK